eukprot:Hpha_TRINITY_DN7134_c0_g1::TRINITY_DN7134_c0_g1_i1::g.29916::m.29916
MILLVDSSGWYSHTSPSASPPPSTPPGAAEGPELPFLVPVLRLRFGGTGAAGAAAAAATGVLVPPEGRLRLSGGCCKGVEGCKGVAGCTGEDSGASGGDRSAF